MLWRTTAWLLLLSVARAQDYKFCTDGTDEPDFEDGDVDVIVGQAPLFSTNPRVGRLFGKLGAFHSSILFTQKQNNIQKYWTLEFDNTAYDFFSGLMPDVIENASEPGGYTFKWHNDARFCLSPGIKWGRSHWSKTFQTVLTTRASLVTKAFKEFVKPVNATSHGQWPQYQLWRVADAGLVGGYGHTLVPDVTCNEGVRWFLFYLKNELGDSFPSDYVFKATAAALRATSVTKVDETDPVIAKKMAAFFRIMHDVAYAPTKWGHLKAVWRYMWATKYVYDNNKREFFELRGWNTVQIPWPHYIEFPLHGPPWQIKSKESSDSATTIV